MDIPAPEAGPTRLGGCRNGYPIRGGITPMPPGIAGPMPPPNLMLPPRPGPRPMPPDVAGMPSVIVERLNDCRIGLIGEDERRWMERSPPPPPIREGMKPPNLPA